MARNVNAETIKKLKQWEAFVGYAYDDADKSRPPRNIKPGERVKGTLTIGYGHTGRDVRAGQQITEAEATELLRNDLDRFEACVEDAVQVELTDNQFGALVSFCFNVGETAFRKSNLVRKLNAGRYDAVPGELLKWTKGRVNGKSVFIPGLQNRRNAEIGLWNKGAVVASQYVDVKPEASKVAGGAAQKVGIAALGAGGIGSQVPVQKLGALSDQIGGWKDQLSQFSSLPSMQTVLLAMTVLGIAAAAIALFLHHEEAKP